MTALPEVVEVTVPMEKRAADRLDQKIRLLAGAVRDNLHKIAALIEDAKQGQIHIALGFASWTAYVADALGGQLELTTESRRSVVELMSGQGLSQRAIAQAVGVSQKTVSRDVQVSHSDSPDPDGEGASASGVPTADTRSKVTGLDGRSYAGRPTPQKPRRRPLTDLTKLALDLRRVNEKVRKLLEDDRFERNRDVIMNQLRPEVAIGLGLLQRLDAAGAQSAARGDS